MPSLVPADHKDDLAQHLSSILHIRAYCIGVEQTVLNPISDPPPDWFNTLNTNLAAAKTHAQVWTQTIEPGITSVIPQTIIAFGTRFNLAANDILQILQASGLKPNAAQRAAIGEHLHWSMRHLNEQQTLIAGLASQFTTFQTNAGTDLTALTSGSNSIQKVLDLDNATIITLQGDILSAQADIKADQAVITASGIAGGVGLFVGVGVLAFGAATGNPFAIAIGGLIMVGSIVEMAVVMSKYAKKLAEARNRLNSDMSQLDQETKQVASLTLLNSSITSLVNLNTGMAQSLVNITNWWSDVEAKLQTVIQTVQDADDDSSQQMWSDLKDDVQAAQSSWNDYAAFATNMQNITTGASVQQVTATAA